MKESEEEQRRGGTKAASNKSASLLTDPDTSKCSSLHKINIMINGEQPNSRMGMEGRLMPSKTMIELRPVALSNID